MATVLCPLSARTQQITSYIQPPSSDATALASRAEALAEVTKPISPNPFEPPSSGKPMADDTDSPESLLLQTDRKFTTTSAEYAFAAPTSFYSFAHGDDTPADWNSSLTGTFTAYLHQDSATAVRMTGDLEIFGQRRQPGTVGDPGAQTFTMQWEASHVLPSKLGAMEIAAGRYQQQLVSYSAFANSPLTDILLGYSASSVGFETTIAVPDRRIGFSFRYGTERLGSIANRAHTALFEFSWTW
jgi:hypothetical protein